MVFLELLVIGFITSLIVCGAFAMCMHDTFKEFLVRFMLTFPLTVLMVIGFHISIGNMTLERVEKGSNNPSIVEKAEIVK